MQTRAYLHLLQLAKMIVQQRKRVKSGGAVTVAAPVDKTDVLVQTRVRRDTQNVAAQTLGTARVKHRRLVILVHQRLKQRKRTIQLGASQRRRQMIQYHRAAPPLRLRSLAGVVHNKRIQQRHPAQQSVRPATARQRHRLAGQPLQVAVLAELHHNINSRAQPEIKRQITMRRHQCRIMISRRRIQMISARRLNADKNFAKPKTRHRERIITEKRVVLGSAPALGHSLAQLVRQAAPASLVIRARQKNLSLARRVRRRRKAEQTRHQRGAVIGKVIAERVSRRAQLAEHTRKTLRRVKADTVGKASVTRRIIRNHKTDAALVLF